MGAPKPEAVAEDSPTTTTITTTTRTTPAPLTQAQFLSWKQLKDADASAKRAEAARKREEDIIAGIVQMNGRELFLHEPGVFDNDLY